MIRVQVFAFVDNAYITYDSVPEEPEHQVPLIRPNFRLVPLTESFQLPFDSLEINLWFYAIHRPLTSEEVQVLMGSIKKDARVSFNILFMEDWWDQKWSFLTRQTESLLQLCNSELCIEGADEETCFQFLRLAPRCKFLDILINPTSFDLPLDPFENITSIGLNESVSAEKLNRLFPQVDTVITNQPSQLTSLLSTSQLKIVVNIYIDEFLPDSLEYLEYVTDLKLDLIKLDDEESEYPLSLSDRVSYGKFFNTVLYTPQLINLEVIAEPEFLIPGSITEMILELPEKRRLVRILGEFLVSSTTFPSNPLWKFRRLDGDNAVFSRIRDFLLGLDPGWVIPESIFPVRVEEGVEDREE